MTKIPQEALNAAMKEAVARKIFPGVSIGTDDYLAKWEAMERVLEAAFRAVGWNPEADSYAPPTDLPERRPLTEDELQEIDQSVKDLGERVDRRQRGEE